MRGIGSLSHVGRLTLGLFIMVLALSATSVLAPAEARTVIHGKAHVVDGGTLLIGGTKIRLAGIVAPNKTRRCISFNHGRGKAPAWHCGLAAAKSLKHKIGHRSVRCVVIGGQRGAALAHCYVGKRNLAMAQVKSGWAQAREIANAPRTSRHLARYQSRAKSSGRGIWRGQLAVQAGWQRSIASATQVRIGQRVRSIVAINLA